MKRTIYALCLVVAAIAVAVAGCGGGDATGSAKTDTGGGKPTASELGIAVISSAKVGDLGAVLVDSEGHTLYAFAKDKHSLYSAFSSACYGACEEKWPPLLTDGEPQAEKGAASTKMSALGRRDGTLQVTYYGHPLYTYAGDSKPGEANGNDVRAFGGEWYALRPNNQKP